MMRILIVVEQTDTGYSAYSPDVEGCVAAAPSREEVEQSMREAISLHLEQLRDEGKQVPEPRSYATYVEVAA
jgi:predicted RNase H-like HicB family nuclease